MEFSGLHYCLFVKVQISCLTGDTNMFRAFVICIYISAQRLLVERRRRDLNPRAAINDLHPFQGCPFGLLGTSPSKLNLINFIFTYRGNLFIPSGESGIRTHAPLRTNGFQDRLVMTTSISLQACRYFSGKNYSSKKEVQCQQLFLNFLSYL